MKSREFFDQFTYAKTKCDDCGGNNHPYMLTNKIWNKVISKKPIPERSVCVCLFCAEKRLGRPLKDSDFNDAPINHGVFGFKKTLWTKGDLSG